jgi:Mlc titration factor MtfA (ptsG expression regulator)
VSWRIGSWRIGSWRKERRALDEDRLIAVLVQNVALARGLRDPIRDRLVRTAASLIEAKRWEAVGGLELTDEIRVTVAANAAVPVLALGIGAYRQVSSIVVSPSITVHDRTRAGPVSGVFSAGPVNTIGLASPHHGPVLLSWDAVLEQSLHPERGRNVVVHEFAHKVDSSDGYSDGVPPVRRDDLETWVEILSDEYERSDTRPSDEVLGAYAWTSPAEFFAVACEVYFCTPARLLAAKPKLFRALSEFFRLDPARADWGMDWGT